MDQLQTVPARGSALASKRRRSWRQMLDASGGSGSRGPAVAVAGMAAGLPLPQQMANAKRKAGATQVGIGVAGLKLPVVLANSVVPLLSDPCIVWAAGAVLAS
jgi:hypothetical protein